MYFVNTFVEEFKQLIQSLHRIHGICGDSSCNFQNIKVENRCISRRKRRSTTDNPISVSFEEVIGYEKQQVIR